MLLRVFITLFASLTIAGCAGAPVKQSIQQHDPIMDQKGGVAIIVDVCNLIDVVGDDDYFVINESKAVADALLRETTAYLQQHGVQVLTGMVPFVCGVYDTPGNAPRKCSEKEGGTVFEAAQPYGIADGIVGDTEYVKALTTLSTYMRERKAINSTKTDDGKKKSETEFQEPAGAINEDRLTAASAIIKSRTGAASILYIGLRGTKISAGKKFGQGLAAFTVGVATGIATAGLGTGYAVSIIPGHNVDWKYSNAGLVNLESGKLVWSHCTSRKGNPLEPEEVAKPGEIDLLLKSLVLKEVSSDTLSKQ